MKPIVNLSLRTEYSFRKTFGKMDDVIQHENGTGYVGCADLNNTFSHVYLEQICKKNNLTPIFGTRLEVVKNARDRVRGVCGPVYIFIAKNQTGLAELNRLVKSAWENFYYKPMLDWRDLHSISDDIFVLAENIETLDDHRIDYIALTPSTPAMLLDIDVPKVYCNDNFFSTPDERKIYQLIAGSQKRADGYSYKFDTKRAFQHVLCSEEFHRIWGVEEAIENTYEIAEQCEVELPRAQMVRYKGTLKITDLCEIGAKEKGINLKVGEYAERYEREMKLIVEKEYVDYFMIVSQMIRKAKKRMLVGPARGSSAGSLVCYLMGITEVDPIRFGLVFERFIDVNRSDLPDIDIDFPDDQRQSVVKDLFKTHGEKNVCHIANINMYKARSALDDIGIALRIPKFEMDTLKDSITEKTGGDARAQMTIEDTLKSTDIGKEFVENYPAVIHAEKMQGHSTHAGKHAAGIIVCNDEITKYGGVNDRENCIMMNKKGAEYLNLLKIDALGLRTLTVLQECAKLVGMDHKEYCNLPLDDEKTYDLFKDMRLYGIFQFEGWAMRTVCDKMGVENFNDIVAITAIARPGPLHSGGAEKFIQRRIGAEEVVYISDNPEYIRATEETFGVIVYQEQLMNICRFCGNMTWGEITAIRKASSKSLGKEYFDSHRDSFLKGTRENGIEDKEANLIWENMITFGNWGMNKSHTVSYGYISYWCAYMKANHPLEFVVSNLRHARTEESAIKILRDAVENDGIEYIPIDPDKSEIDWSVKDGRLVGGLINIKGIGLQKAKDIISCRTGKKKWTPSIIKHLMDPVTPFDTIYPCRDLWGDIYENPRDYGLAYPPMLIKDIPKEGGPFVFIGKITRKNLRDLNEYSEVAKRGGKILEKNKTLKMTVEDDTGALNCSINRHRYDELNGNHLSETLVVGSSWVIIRGTVISGWNVIAVENIFDLKELGD